MGQAQDYVRQDRSFIYGRGNELAGRAKERRDEERLKQAYYGSYADEAFDPLIGGRGGYSPEEAESIRREQELQGLLPGQADYESNYLGDAEKEAIAGHGWEREKYYNPDFSNDQQNTSEVFQRGARTGLRSGLQGAINEPDLRVSEGYNTGINETLGTSEDRVRGAVDVDRLRQDPEYAARVRMSEQEKQDIVTGAGISAGTGYRAAIGDLERGARASGVDAGGIAAMKERLLRQSGGAAGDAMTQARIHASDAAYDRERDIEAGRRSGETTAAGLVSGNELALEDRRLSATDRLESQRLNAARDIGDRYTYAAQQAGQADIAGEQAINAQRRNVDQYNQGLGTQIATGQEQDAADRARWIAANRQQTGQANQASAFDRGYAVNNTLAARNTGIADERLAQAREGRGYLVHQGDRASGNVNTAAGQELGIYGTQGGLSQGTTQQQYVEENKPKWWEKTIGAVTGLASAASGFYRPKTQTQP